MLWVDNTHPLVLSCTSPAAGETLDIEMTTYSWASEKV